MAARDAHEQLERARAHALPPERNPGIPLDLELVDSVRACPSAIERRAATLASRRAVKKARKPPGSCGP